MRGFIISLTALLGIALIFMLITLLVSGIAGGARSTGLFGWSETPILAGVERFVTTMYNALIYISSWVRVFVLFAVFLAVQGVFVYFYYKIGKTVLRFRKDMEKILDEFLDV
jgi:hypothetical protein